MNDLIKLSKIRTQGFARSNGADPNTVYFTTDTHEIFVGGVSYGNTADLVNRVEHLEEEIPSIESAAEGAAEAAETATAKAAETAQALTQLQAAIGNLPDGQAVSAEVALLRVNKAEIVSVSGLTATAPNNVLKDSNNNPIKAGDCKLVYSRTIGSTVRHYDCNVMSFRSPNTDDTYYVAWAKVGAMNGDTHEYKYWVFIDYANDTGDSSECAAIYNEETLPSNIREHLEHSYKVVDLGTQSTFNAHTTGSTFGYYEISTANLFTSLSDIWSYGKLPVINVELSNHTSSFIIPVYKKGTTFVGYAIKKGYQDGGYFIDVEITSTTSRIYVKEIGSYTKPVSGIPATDLAESIQLLLVKANNSASKEYVDTNFAKQNGTYENLSVGSAKKLESEEPVKESFFSRPTGGRDAEIANGNAQWQGVGGNSVKFNQLVQNGDMSDTSSPISTYFRPNVDGLLLSYSDSYLKGEGSTISVIADTVSVITGHKYFIASNIVADGTFQMFHRIGGVSGPNIFGVSGYKKQIITANTTGPCSVTIAKPTAYIKNWQVVDLTAIGIDNLTTTAQVEAWLEEHVGLQEYYDYTEGEVINVNLTGIESVNRNLLDANGDAQIIGEYDDTYGNYYGIKGTHGTITFTDKLGNATTITPDAEGKFYLDVEGKLHVADKDDTTIVFLWYDGSETDYVEHEVNVGRLDLTHIYGKKNGTGDLVRVWPTGACGIGDIKDLLTIEGGAVVAKKKCKEVDLGDSSMTHVNSSTYGYWTVNVQGVKGNNNSPANVIAEPASRIVKGYGIGGSETDITIGVQEAVDGGIIVVNNQSTTNQPTFNVICELIATITYTDLVYMGSEYFEDGTPVALPVNYEADNWGIENILPKNTSTILTAKPEITCLYSMDLAEMVDTQRQQIENLDEKKANTNGTYSNMSVGSADNLSGKNPVDIEFTAHKTGDPNIVAKGLAQLNEVRGTSLVWNQIARNELSHILSDDCVVTQDGDSFIVTPNEEATSYRAKLNISIYPNHYYYYAISGQYTGSGTAYASVQINNGSSWAEYGKMTFTSSLARQSVIFQSPNVANNHVVNLLRNITSSGTGEDEGIVKDFLLIDLTLMFGEGNEPTSVEEFEKLYPLPYYAYNAGSIVNNNAEGLEVIGFNQWDEEWELGAYSFDNGAKEGSNVQIRCKNKIRVFPNTSYYFKSSDSMWAAIYDSNGTYIGGLNSQYSFGNQVITMPNNASFVTFWCRSNYGTTYKNDICINISNASRNGTYEPYKRVVVDLNIPTLTGKKVVNGSTEGQESVVIFQDTVGEQVVTGMKGVGTAYDVIQQDADKVLRKATKRFGVVTLTGDNSESYDLQSINEYNIANFAFDIIDRRIGEALKSKCDRLLKQTSLIAQTKDRGYLAAAGTNMYIRIESSIASNVEQLRSYLSSNPITFVYELATPEEYILDTPIVNNYEEDGDGVERRLPEDTSSVVNAPLPLKVTYPIDAVGQLLDMPKDYDTVGSLDNLCSALATTLSSALNGTFNITRGAFDTATNKYTFTCTFTPNEVGT